MLIILGLGIFVLLIVNLYFEIKNQRSLRELARNLVEGTLKLNKSVNCMIKTLTSITEVCLEEDSDVDLMQLKEDISSEIEKLKGVEDAKTV